MTESDIKQIKDFWESGLPLEQIYQMLPYTRYEGIKMVRELRENGTLKPRKKTQSAIEKVAYAWENETKNTYALAEMFGYAHRTVEIYLSNSGIRKGKRNPTNFKHCDKTNDIIVDLQGGDLSQVEIARKHQVSRQYITDVKRKLEKWNEPN